ncbi:MAG: hypothetical protein V1779_02130 [bacterium]
MKNILFGIIIFVLFLNHKILFSQENHDTIVASTNNYSLMTSIGIGYHSFCLLLSPGGSCDNYTDYDPSIAGFIGLELPFEKKQIVTLEFSMIAINAKNLRNWNSSKISYYNKTLFNPNLALNIYFLSINKKIRPSIYLGFFGLPIYGLNFGASIDVSVYQNILISLAYRNLYISKGWFRNDLDNLLYPEIIFLSAKYSINF